MWLSFSQFRISCTQVFDKLICETVLRSRSQRHNREEPSIGARFQIEGESGLTDHRACLGSKSEIIGSCTDDYFLHRFLVNEIILASSARFPCLNNKSRDSSPPWVWKATSTIKLWAKCIAAHWHEENRYYACATGLCRTGDERLRDLSRGLIAFQSYPLAYRAPSFRAPQQSQSLPCHP